MPDVLDRLGEQLEEIRIPSSADRRQATLIVAVREVVERQQTSSPRRALGGLRAALVAALLIAFVVAFTPPGQAAAEWIAEKVGIGEPGGEPTLREYREFTTEGSSAEGVRATVLARGSTPFGEHYEYLTYEENRYGSRCYELNLVNAGGGPSGSWGGACERAEAPERGAGAANEPLSPRGDLRVDATGGNMDPDQRFLLVVGRVSADVASVVVTFNGSELETQVTVVSEELADEVGIEHPFKVFAAFSRQSVAHGGLIQVTARDEDGEEVAQFSRNLVDMAAGRAALCEDLRERAEAPRGMTKDEAARYCESAPRHFDPDPTTDPAELYSELIRAQRRGDEAAEQAAAEAIRQEILSRSQQPRGEPPD